MADSQSREVGFTGTRQGMTDHQYRAVQVLLSNLKPERVHHGDCIGADADFDEIAEELGIHREAWPGTNSHGLSPQRAFTDAETVHPAGPYLGRNRVIVDRSSVMIAVPGGPERQRGSGTWQAIRYATGRKTTYIVWPDGKTELRMAESR